MILNRLIYDNKKASHIPIDSNHMKKLKRITLGMEPHLLWSIDTVGNYLREGRLVIEDLKWNIPLHTSYQI